MHGIRRVVALVALASSVGAVAQVGTGGPAGAAPAAAVAAARDDSSPGPSQLVIADGAAQFAIAQIGKAYQYGAEGPLTYDNSGLIVAAYASVGVVLPHNAMAQFAATSRVTEAGLAPGDLVFYHEGQVVAVYVGAGNVVGVYHPATFVHESSIDFEPVYAFGRVQ